VDFCPKGILFLSGDFNSKGYHPAAIRDEEQCTGCSLCEMVCPDFSIFLVEGDEGQDEQ
jgi:2-oxoglutarate ferredoxin oxidoreductase subunit delta